MAKTMKAAGVRDFGKPLTIEEVPVPEVMPGRILVKVEASGVCHTDWDSKGWGRPLVLGHEGAGIVKLVGTAVKHVKPGDRVLLNWAIPCYTCFQCQEGNQHICERNSAVTEVIN